MIASAVALAAVVALAFALALLALGHRPDGDDWWLLLTSVCASTIAAVLYGPVRERVRRVDEHRDPLDVLERFVSRLSRAIPLEESLLQLAESLRGELGLTAAAIWTGDENSLERVVADPPRAPARVTVGPIVASTLIRSRASGRAWITTWLPELAPADDDASVQVVPIVHAGRLLGAVVVERQAPALEPEEIDLLVDLSRQLALLLHNVRLDGELQASLSEIRRQADELRESRARLLVIADVERRKIERDLHDGAQQQLLALAMGLQAARRSVDREPAVLAAQLDQLAAALTEATRELRRLSQGIYPPLLAESGLREALADIARRAAVVTRVELEDVRRYPAQIEASVYFCCLEALQNAAKHAGTGATVLVRLWEDEAGLGFSVSDDGHGFTPGAGGGVGLLNMRDRIGATGGTLRIEAAPGTGTSITATIPFRERRFIRRETSARP